MLILEARAHKVIGISAFQNRLRAKANLAEIGLTRRVALEVTEHYDPGQKRKKTGNNETLLSCRLLARPRKTVIGVTDSRWLLVKCAGGRLPPGIDIENPFLNRHSQNVRVPAPAAQSLSLLSRPALSSNLLPLAAISGIV